MKWIGYTAVSIIYSVLFVYFAVNEMQHLHWFVKGIIHLFSMLGLLMIIFVFMQQEKGE